MESGDILLFKGGKDIVSKIISWGTRSKYTHVAVCVDPAMNLAIEAIFSGGVRARDIRLILRDYDVYRIREVYKYNLNGTISYLVSKLNKRYDKWGVAYLGLLKVLAKIGFSTKKKANRWQKKRDYFCSELLYEAFYVGGQLDIVPQINEADMTSPGDIASSPIVEFMWSK